MIAGFLLAVMIQAPGVTGLRIEYLTNPLGIDATRPRFSWRLTSAERNTVQSAYQIQVTRNGRPVWDSGRITADSSVFVSYAGPPLESRTRYTWRVRVWDGKARASAWSAPAWWEMGLLQPSDWSAAWIGPSATDSSGGPAPLLRRAFLLRGAVASARLYATSLGLYELYLNGRRVSDWLFTPGWTSYNRRLQYQTYDVTALLRAGDNAIGAILGDGWYRGQLGFSGGRAIYGTRLGLLVQLEVRYSDGRMERIVSDSGWKTSTGPILASDIYGGETYDARQERAGWSNTGYDDRAWAPVARLPAPSSRLLAPQSPPVRRVSEIRPVAIRRTQAGEAIFDLGQNFTGWARLKVRGAAGTTVTLRFAEVLDKDGNLYTANLRRAAQTDRYTLKGGADEVYEPHFTFHGFRYVGVSGLPSPGDTSTITGIVVSSDLAQSGSFETSDSLLNRLQHNIVWGQRSNFLDVPTDCPQRDERLGWTGDAQVFAPTAAFNLDVGGFFAKWLGDVAADQDKSGALPWVIPDVLGADSANGSGTAGWSDAAVIVPWTMYVAYGDRALLARQYPSMRAWVDFEHRRAGAGLVWRPGWQFGDWLALHSDDPSYPGATTSTDFIATAYFAHSTDIVARAARALGNAGDADRYEQLFRDIRAAFNREFVSAGGRVGENTQTAYALAIAFDLLPDSLVPVAADRLAAAVRARGMHLTTGFLGTPQLLPVLSATGHLDVAYALLMQQSYPSWLYPITRGATTMWERWDGIRPDSTFEDAGMNSFNHYAFGAVGDWMYGTIAGIRLDPAAPGAKHVWIAPRPGGGLTRAKASLETPYGTLVSSWRLDSGGGRFMLTVTVPPNTTADVTLPGTTVPVTVGSGTYEFTKEL
ncbi:MAG TPA: glycoside hydrolase family 78 protein [Gemmatimonadales bacterium]|nr:glycoside hydrolase family 78 protein [Gemmatimonadales bacterium]